jgi:hypothetical protein
LGQEQRKWRLKIRGKSWEDIGLKVYGFETTSRIVDCNRILESYIKPDSCLSALGKEGFEILYSGMFYADGWLCGEGS